jgi:hypothetical protein
VSSKPKFIVLIASAFLAASLLAAAPASATFHLMKIREVSSGTGVADSSYVEIQAYSPFQNFLSNGAKVAVCNDICSIVPAEFTGFTDVASGANQMTVVVGDSGLPGASKDFTRDLNLDSKTAGGAVCYLSEPGYSDCVSWGNFNANSTLMANYGTTAGTPAPALVSGMALRRSIAAGCPTALEASDDTNNSAGDFALTTPNPRPNSVAPTEMTCGPAGPTGYPTTPGSPPTRKKKKCKKRKKASSGGGGTSGGGPTYAAKKKCKKKRR